MTSWAWQQAQDRRLRAGLLLAEDIEGVKEQRDGCGATGFVDPGPPLGLGSPRARGAGHWEPVTDSRCACPSPTGASP
jgi:hypothetical protein